MERKKTSQHKRTYARTVTIIIIIIIITNILRRHSTSAQLNEDSENTNECYILSEAGAETS